MSIPSRTRLAIAILTLPALVGCNLFGGEDDLKVVEYSGPEFTHSDSHREWTAQIEGDDVTLTAIPGPISPSSTLIITLEHVPDALPMLTDVWTGPHGGGIGQQIKDATVEVKSWELEGLISGALRMELPNGGKIYERFWIEIPAPTG